MSEIVRTRGPAHECSLDELSTADQQGEGNCGKENDALHGSVPDLFRKHVEPWIGCSANAFAADNDACGRLSPVYGPVERTGVSLVTIPATFFVTGRAHPLTTVRAAVRFARRPSDGSPVQQLGTA